MVQHQTVASKWKFSRFVYNKDFCLFYNKGFILLFSLLFHAGQAAIKLPSAEASKWAQCTSPGQYTPYIKGIMNTP